MPRQTGIPFAGEYFYVKPEDVKLAPKEPLINIIPRDEWGAAPPIKHEALMKLPVKHIRYNETGTDTCMTKDECSTLLQAMQKDHMENKGFNDIRYNFMIDGAGIVYEGRGWEVRPQIHAGLQGKDYLDVAYIGNFANSSPNWEQCVTGQRFLKFAFENDSLDRKYEVTHLKELVDL